MVTLISENWLLFLIALAIGFVTAFWIWAGTGRESSEAEQFDANDGLLEKADEVQVPADPEPEPSVEPEPAVQATAVAAASLAAEKVEAAPAPTPTPKPAPRPRKKPVVEEKAAPPPAGSKPKIAAAVGEPDNLRLIKGVGPKLNSLLHNLGVTRFDQIAGWKAEDIAEMDKYLETFSGRITRDAWIDQAKFLAKDDIEGFEKKYGKL